MVGKKAQAAMEFLMTYGWAIMVVLVVIGALVYFMGPNIVNSMIPTKCLSGDPGITCKGSKVTATSVDLRFQNNYHEPVTVDRVSVVKNGVEVCRSDDDTLIAAGATVDLARVTGCTNIKVDSKEKLSITTSFYKQSEGSSFSHPAKGEVVATAGPVGTQSGPGLSCLDILNGGGSTGDGIYWVDPDGSGPVAQFQVYCDMTTGGGGWTLIGKGREDWTWNGAGQGTLDDLTSNPDSNTVAYMSTATINSILNSLGKNLNQLSDGIRINRRNTAGTLNQKYVWKFTAQTSWTWNFPSGMPVDVWLNDVSRGTFNTGDQYTTGVNDCTRIFTWAWHSHNYVMGFSAGGSCSCSYGWCFTSEDHAIMQTKIWVRS